MLRVVSQTAGGKLAGATVLDRLAQEGRITADQRERATLHARRGGDHCLDALIDTGTLASWSLTLDP